MIEKIISDCILWFLHKLKIKIEPDRIGTIIQFIKFAIVGVTNTLISYFLYIAVIIILQPFDLAFDYFLANIVAFILSVLWSFYWNNKCVFTIKDGEKRNWLFALIKTFLAYSFSGLVLNNIFSYLFITCMGISKYVAPIINMLIGVPINFIVNKFWAFKTEVEEKTDKEKPVS